MRASPSTALRAAVHPGFHFGGQACPYCDQPIPKDKLEEISGRIEARTNARLVEETARLRDQHANEQAQLTAKANEELDRVKREAQSTREKLMSDAAAREASIREEANRTATEAALADLKRAQDAQVRAEEERAGLVAQLEAERAENATNVEQLARDAAAREEAVRVEATRAAQVDAAERLAAAEGAKAAAELALAEHKDEIDTLKETHANEINAQREVLEKDKIATVNAERAGFLKVKMKLEEDLADVQRRLQQKTADEHGEGAELDLYEVLRAAFEGDRIRRVPRGSPGADVIHEVVEDGRVVGKIVYDSKNRGNWMSEYAVKLRKDQIAEKADYAVLSTNKFPKNHRELCTFEQVILACPARVLAIAEILRGQIVVNSELRIGSVERERKATELYEFINSPLSRQLLESVQALVGKMEQVDIDEQNAHQKVWDKRATLRQAVLKSNGDFRFQVRRIVGTVDTGG